MLKKSLLLKPPVIYPEMPVDKPCGSPPLPLVRKYPTRMSKYLTSFSVLRNLSSSVAPGSFVKNVRSVCIEDMQKIAHFDAIKQSKTSKVQGG